MKFNAIFRKKAFEVEYKEQEKEILELLESSISGGVDIKRLFRSLKSKYRNLNDCLESIRFCDLIEKYDESMDIKFSYKKIIMKPDCVVE